MSIIKSKWLRKMQSSPYKDLNTAQIVLLYTKIVIKNSFLNNFDRTGGCIIDITVTNHLYCSGRIIINIDMKREF